MLVNFFVHSGHDIGDFRERAPLASTLVERWYIAPGVQRIDVREKGVRATLFIPPGILPTYRDSIPPYWSILRPGRSNCSGPKSPVCLYVFFGLHLLLFSTSWRPLSCHTLQSMAAPVSSPLLEIISDHGAALFLLVTSLLMMWSLLEIPKVDLRQHWWMMWTAYGIFKVLNKFYRLVQQEGALNVLVSSYDVVSWSFLLELE